MKLCTSCWAFVCSTQNMREHISFVLAGLHGVMSKNHSLEPSLLLSCSLAERFSWWQSTPHEDILVQVINPQAVTQSRTGVIVILSSCQALLALEILISCSKTFAFRRNPWLDALTRLPVVWRDGAWIYTRFRLRTGECSLSKPASSPCSPYIDSIHSAVFTDPV